jgi:hypothetical protein
VRGEGYLHIPYNEKISFNDKTQILYIRIASNAWLYTWLDNQILRENFPEALKSLDLFSVSERKTKKYALYTAIYDFRTSVDGRNSLEKIRRIQKESE